jgi:hypothetical protein
MPTDYNTSSEKFHSLSKYFCPLVKKRTVLFRYHLPHLEADG